MSILGVTYNPDCWLAVHGRMEHDDPMPSCEGRLIRAHLIDQQQLRRRGLEVGDPATYVLACGGLSGLNGHHGLFDGYRLRLPFGGLPVDTIRFAAENGLSAWLEWKYRP